MLSAFHIRVEYVSVLPFCQCTMKIHCRQWTRKTPFALGMWTHPIQQSLEWPHSLLKQLLNCFMHFTELLKNPLWFQWDAQYPPSKLPIFVGRSSPWLLVSSLDPTDPSSQMPSRSSQPFSTIHWTDIHTDRLTDRWDRWQNLYQYPLMLCWR